MIRLLTPREAAQELASKVARSWAKWVVAEADEARLAEVEHETLSVLLRRSVPRSQEDILRHPGVSALQRWYEQWDIELPKGCTLDSSTLVRGRPADPHRLYLVDLSAVWRFVEVFDPSSLNLLPGIPKMRALAQSLREAGIEVTEANLRAVARLAEADRPQLLNLVTWLSQNPDLTDYTRKQLPVPGLHTKWLTPARLRLVEELAGRDLAAELPTRPGLVLFTYVDPNYLSRGERRHDSWTVGDVPVVAYQPDVVLLVGNRDVRLRFPEFPGLIVVEADAGAAGHLTELSWVLKARVVAFWDDLDADGFAALSRLRTRFGKHGHELPSILMDGATLTEFGPLKADTDQHSQPLTPRGGSLPGLTGFETAAYSVLATRGPTEVRRVEQEKLPLERAIQALETLMES